MKGLLIKFKNQKTENKIVIGIAALSVLAVISFVVWTIYISNQPELSKASEICAQISVDGDRISIRNSNTYDWINTDIKLNTYFKLFVNKIRSGETRSVAINEFASNKGERFDNNIYKVVRVSISCTGNGISLYETFIFQ